MAEFVGGFWILLELICSFFFCDSLLLRRAIRKTTYIWYAVGWLWIFLYTNIGFFDIPIVYITVVTHLLLSYVSYNGSWFRHLIAILMSILLLCIIDTLIIYISCLIFHSDLNDLLSQKYVYFTVVTWSKGLSLLISWTIRHFSPNNINERVQWRWLALTLFFPSISLIMLIAFWECYQINSDISAKAFTFTLAIILGNIAIMYIIRHLERIEKESQRAILLQQQMDIQTQSILALEKSYRAQRAASHEFVHHLHTIDSFLLEGNYESLKQYLGQLLDQQSIRVLSINSRHPTIDAVLNQKYQIAQEHSIEMHVKVNDLSTIKIPDTHIVVLLSNLLDNAIEACQVYEKEKVIKFSMILDESIFLTVENSSSPVCIFDNEIVTTKNDKNYHGYGLPNIKCILASLNAEYALRYKNHYFSFAAEIPN